VSLFILAGVSQQIAWLSLSPVGPVADGKQLGALIAFTQTILSGENVLNAFNRYPYPDMTGFFTMIAVFLMVVYFEGMRIEIPVAYARYGGLRAKIPLKFLYVSNIPIILASALFANILFFSRVIWMNFNPDNSNPILNLIVRFSPQGERGFTPLPGSLVYYLTPVRSISEAMTDPVHAVVYTIILCVLSVAFAIVWVQVAGMSARDQAENLVKAGLQVPGFRSSTRVIEQVLNRYIPPLTIISGLIIGLIAAIADMLGALGSGIGILLSVGIIYQYYEILARERLEETYPALSRIFGR
ncbi:MAG: preprotein translocase subunit SecY, partial [Candidatus Methanomethylicota archaeon]